MPFSHKRSLTLNTYTVTRDSMFMIVIIFRMCKLTTEHIPLLCLWDSFFLLQHWGVLVLHWKVLDSFVYLLGWHFQCCNTVDWVREVHNLIWLNRGYYNGNGQMQVLQVCYVFMSFNNALSLYYWTACLFKIVSTKTTDVFLGFQIVLTLFHCKLLRTYHITFCLWRIYFIVLP